MPPSRPATDPPARRPRADARRNVESVREAARAVFAEQGVDAPVRDIAARAGVGVGTLYRHFPQRTDLVVAVFTEAVDACAAAATELAAELEPAEAVRAWLHRFADFVATKHGLARALHSGDPAFERLPAYFAEHLQPALEGLLAGAVDAGAVRADVTADQLIDAVRGLADQPAMIDVLADGLAPR